jgi:hypothetical protein
LTLLETYNLTIEESLSFNLLVFAALTDSMFILDGFWDNGAFLKAFVVIVVVILAVQRNILTAALLIAFTSLLLAAAFLLALVAVLVVLALVVSVAALNEAVSSDDTLLTESAISPFLLWVLSLADLALKK